MAEDGVRSSLDSVRVGGGGSSCLISVAAADRQVFLLWVTKGSN